MGKRSASFSHDLITALRRRVADHNEFVGNEGQRVTLNLTKRWYELGFRGDPDAALQKVDGKLVALAKAAGLDDSKHPRARNGEFRATGPKQASLYRDVAKPDDHRALTGSNAGYAAAQTDVIPETRYEVLLPGALSTAGIALGALHGITSKPRGNVLDRVQHRVASRVGRTAGKVAAGVAINGPIRAIRRARVARGTGSPDDWADTIQNISRAGGNVGAWAGRTSSKGLTLASNTPSWLARKATRWVLANKARTIKGKLAIATAGAIVGGVTPGLAYAHLGNATGAAVAPALDASFPRHVQKGFDAGLLALLDQVGGLQKVDAPFVGDGFGEALEKAGLGTLGREVVNALRNVRFGATRAIAAVGAGAQAVRHPSTIAAAAAPAFNQAVARLDAAVAQSTGKYRRSGVVFNRHAQAAIVAGDAGRGLISVAPLGASLGAIAGTIMGHFSDQDHPRDQRGRFTSKGQGAKHGALIGGALGTVVGLGAGALAGRGRVSRYQIKQFRDLAEKLKANFAGDVEKARTHAARIHALGFAEGREPNTVTLDSGAELPGRKAKPRKYGPVPKSDVGLAIKNGRIEPALYREQLEAQIMRAFNADEGRAIKAGDRAYLRWQVESAFDAEAKRLLPPLATRGAGSPIRDGSALTKTRDLYTHVDPEKLNEAQRKVWDDLVDKRGRVMSDLDEQVKARASDNAAAKGEHDSLQAERAKLDAVQDAGQEDLRQMLAVTEAPQTPSEKAASIRKIKSTVKQFFGHDIKGKALDDVVAEATRVAAESAESYEARVASIEARMNKLKGEMSQLGNLSEQTVTESERKAIVNPFRKPGEKGEPYFPPRPAIKQREAELLREDGRLDAFDRGQNAAMDHAEVAYKRGYAARMNALEQHANPSTALDLLSAAMPHLAAHARRARMDVAAMNEALKTGEPQGDLGELQNVLFHDHDLGRARAYVRKIGSKAAAAAKAGLQWTVQNRAPIIIGANVLGTVGAINLSAGKGKRKVEWNPAEWKLPRDMALEHHYVDPVNDPLNIVSGVSFTDPRTKQRVFLQGVHNREKDYVVHGFGVPVDAVVGSAKARAERQRQGNQPSQQPGQQPGQQRDAKIKVDQAIEDQIKQMGDKIQGVGDPEQGGTFRQNSTKDFGNTRKAVRDAFIDANLKFARGNPSIKGTLHDKHFFPGLQDLFDSPQSAALNLDDRARLLLGTGQHQERGLIGGSEDLRFAAGSKPKAAEALRQQIAAVPPRDAAEASLWKKAVWVASEHLGLDDDQRDRLFEQVDASLKRRQANPGDARPAGQQQQQQPRQAAPAAARSEPAKPAFNADSHNTDGLAEHIRAQQLAQKPNGQFPKMDVFRASVARRYQQKVVELRADPEYSGKSDEDLRDAAIDAVEDDLLARKADAALDLRKYMAWDASMHPRASAGSPDGGEFTSDGGGAAGGGGGVNVPGHRGVKALVRNAAQRSRRQVAPSVWNKRAAPGSFASYAVGDIAARLASRALKPTAAAQSASAMATAALRQAAVSHGSIGDIARYGANLAGKVAGAGLRLGVKTAASVVGGGAAQVGLDAIFHPKEFVQKPGEAAARIGGGIAGAVAGEAVGGVLGSTLGPLGTIAGSAIGGYVGENGAALVERFMARRYGNAVAQTARKYL